MGVYDYFVCFCHCGYDSCSCLSDLGIYSICPDKRRTQSDSKRLSQFIVGISFGYFLLFSIVLEFSTNMSAVIRNSQSSKVRKSVESILFFSGSRINYDYSSGFHIGYTRHYSFTGSLRIKCHHIQDCL